MRLFVKRLIVKALAITLLMVGSFFAFFNLPSANADSIDYNPFKIRVVDSETGRGIPLVEVWTVNHAKYVTDSAGYVAFFEPGLMEEDVWFSFQSHGYSHNYESFGAHGKTLTVTPGGEATIEMDRINIAERMYRITGQGIYRDSVLLGLDTPIKDPLLGEDRKSTRLNSS